MLVWLLGVIYTTLFVLELVYGLIMNYIEKINGKKYIKGWFYIPTSSHLLANDAALIS